MIFSFCDESYAILTGTETPDKANRSMYFFFIALIIYITWNIGTVLGVFVASLLVFDTTGIEFTMAAMFIVILLEQIKFYKSPLPFLIGGLTALASLILLGGNSMMLSCAAGSAVLLMFLRHKGLIGCDKE